MAGQNIQLFILQNQKINVVNPNFQYYNNGWSGASSGGYTAASYPCLTGGTSLISIPIFANWNWVNGAMKHTAYSGGISMDDSIYTSLDNINLNDTYSITYDIAGNTNTGGTITISLYDQNGTIRNTNGRFTEYLTPTDFGTHKPLQISVSSRFNGSITNIIINKIGTEKKYLDLVNSDFFSMNFQTLTDISTKGGTYSFNFDILADGNNLQQLSPINDVSYWFDASNTIELNNNNFFNKIIPAGLAVKDFPFLYGQLIPQGSTKSNGILSTIQCFFTGELRSFADEIGDKKLTGNDFDENGEQTYDLDFSEYDHIFNQNNILASHNTVDDYITLDGNNSSGLTNFYNNSCGFYYSFIDLDGPSSINLVETNKTLIQNIRPNIYVKEIWDKIWEKTSYNYQSNFLNSNIFKSLVIPCTFDLSNNYIKDINGHYPIEFQLGLSENFDGTGPKTNKWSGVDHHSLYSTRADHFINPGHDWTGGQDEQPTCNYEYINFDLTGGTSAIPGKDYYKGENVTYAYPQWTISETGTYNIGIVYDFSLYFEAWTLNQTLYDTGDHLVDGKINIITDIKVLLKNGTYKDLSTDNITEISVPGDLLTSGTEKIYGTVQNIIEKQELYKGDKIVVRVGIQNATNITGNSSIRSQFWMIMQANKSFFFNEYIPRNYFVLGQTVNLDVCLPPNTGQIDFIKDIMNTFCLIAQPVQGTKDILIEPWNDFFNYDNKNDYILWRGTDSSGNTINKIDDSGDIEIETIPDLLYQRVYMHYQDDTNDTNLKKYSDQYQKVWGNQRIQNPYLNTDTKEIMNSFSPTAMNYFGTTKWIVPQIYNVDSRPEYINIPSEETFNKDYGLEIRLLIQILVILCLFLEIMKKNMDIPMI